jgi:hypothetical protein
MGCGGGHKEEAELEPQEQTAPLPTAGLAGQRVSLFPITLVAAEDSLHWQHLFADRRATLNQADSVIGEMIGSRAPEVTWVFPPELRGAARRSAGVAASPDQMGTAILRAGGMTDVPDPLRSQMRSLIGIAGGRYALIPAALIFRRTVERPDSRTAPVISPTANEVSATAELAIVLVDARLGKIGWRTVARGNGATPWTALTAALKKLTPGLP